MTNELYWVSSLAYAVVLIIVLINDLFSKKKPNDIEKAFRLMSVWVIFFCMQDTLWGLCASHKITSDTIFFISSSIFHASTVITTFFWLNYVLIYASGKSPVRKTILLLDGFVITCEILLITANCVTPILFKIQKGIYITGPLRPLTFINQYVVYLIVGCSSLFFSVTEYKDDTRKQEQYRTIFFATMAPILLGVFQLLYPDAPFYSLGYFLGCFLLHILVIARDRQDAEKETVFKSIANTFYSMHLIDIDEDSVEPYIESPLLAKAIGDKNKSAQQMIENAARGTSDEFYLKDFLSFVDFSTLSERMKDKNIISYEFIGKNFGWTRMSLISVQKEGDLQKKIMVTTQVIDSEKRSQIDLLNKSYNDELTGLLNRRAYDQTINEIEEKGIPNNLVFISMDVNGLKIANDTLGHAAGDELLLGASECMKKGLSTYGKVFRTGGDEFNAIIYASKSQLKQLKQDFQDTIDSWSGKLIDSISISCGFVERRELPKGTINDLSIRADEKMYEAKSKYYNEKGVDRRGQKDAHVVLCALYTKILKINITEDSYQIVTMDNNEQTPEKGFSDSISSWLLNYAKTGQIHPDDMETYLYQTSISYLREYFLGKKSSLSIFYKRKYGEEFKQAMMEIIPANDYTDSNQTLFLYVKTIDQ